MGRKRTRKDDAESRPEAPGDQQHPRRGGTDLGWADSAGHPGGEQDLEKKTDTEDDHA